MERHAALPHAVDAARIGEQLLRAVHEHVADAAAEDSAERGVEHDVVDLLDLDRAPRLLRARAHAEPRRDEAGEVHEAVPTHLERAETEQRADADRDGIEFGVLEQAAFTDCSASVSTQCSRRCAVRLGLRAERGDAREGGIGV